MTGTTSKRRTVKVDPRGQVTIPKEFREALGIDAGTLLVVALVGDHLEIARPRQAPAELRRYTDDDIERFLREDRLDDTMTERVRDLQNIVREAR